MKLQVGREIIENASKEVVLRAVRSLGRLGKDIVILSKYDNTYLQTCEWNQPGFQLEYQDGSINKHYQAASIVTADGLALAFESYAIGSNSWKEMFLWVKMDLGGETKSQADQKTNESISLNPKNTNEALKIFGLSAKISQERLRKLYLEKIRKCHPDHVQTMDDEFKELAEKKSKVLNEAYRILMEQS